MHTKRDWQAIPGSAEELVDMAAAMLCAEGPRQLSRFDQFPAPVYATDDRGKLIYYNAASVEFAGRTPTLDVDHWCVSWKMRREDGTELPHDQCPMAVAVSEGRAVRGIEAYAERPDGEQRRFRPFPTPAFDGDGKLLGAVNLLVPVDGTAHAGLLATAAKCRNLAQWVSDSQASETLRHMADECDSHAAVLRLD